MRWRCRVESTTTALLPLPAALTRADVVTHRSYSPGVAEPCLAIKARPALAYEYTAKGRLVGLITNGSGVLGLGNVGAVASKPVMEVRAQRLLPRAPLHAAHERITAY